MSTPASRAAQAVVTNYRTDWALWGQKILGLPWNDCPEMGPGKGFVFTDDQKGLIKSVQEHKYTLGQAAHGVGKTYDAAFIGLAFLCLYRDSRVIFTSSSQRQVNDNLWGEFTRMYRRARMPLGGELSATRLRFNEKWFALATATNDPNNFQGGHAEHILIVMDEAQGVDDGIWEAAESMVVNEGGRILAIFNPLSASGPAYAATRKPGQWNLVKLSSLRHPNVIHGREIVKGAISRKEVEEKRQSLGEEHPLYQSRILGEFPTTSEDTLLSIADLEAVLTKWTPLEDGIWLGVDIARFGSDSSWAVVVLNGKVIFEEWWGGLDTMLSVGRIQKIVQDYDIPWDHVSIDDGNMGGGVVDRLHELNKEVNGIPFGSKPVGDWEGYGLDSDGMTFLNRRAEMYWNVRALVKNHRLMIPRKYTRIWEDLLTPKYNFRSDGVLRIEGKDDIRARIHRSPDASDAMVLAMSRDKAGSPSISFV